MDLPEATPFVSPAYKSALVLASPSEATFIVRGADRLSWLNGLVTCDLTKLAPPDAAYGLLLNKLGRIQADLTVVVWQDELLVVVPTSERDAVMNALDRFLVMEDAALERGPDAVVCRLHGPSSEALVAAARSLGWVAARIDMTGLGGGVVLIPANQSRDELLGAASGASTALPGDDADWEALRLERGVPRFGVDFDGTTYPQEAGLERRAVSFSKGCYLGQEVVCMLELRGHVKRKLVVLQLDGESVPARGAEVLDEAGVPVGQVTSAAFSPARKQPLAFAMVKVASGAPGARLTVLGAQGVVMAAASERAK